MCLQYLNKFFGSGSRRRSNAANGGASPRASLANVPQVSLDTLRNAKSAKSVKSAKSAKSGSAAANRPPINVSNQLASSVSSMESEIRPAAPAVSGGEVLRDTANPSTLAGASGSGHSERRSTWWGYFGMGRKKKSSNEML